MQLDLSSGRSLQDTETTRKSSDYFDCFVGMSVLQSSIETEGDVMVKNKQTHLDGVQKG